MEKRNFEAVQQVRDILARAKHAVFFGGAGVSTDSGIPDFRGTGGLYRSAGAGNEYYLSRECLHREPERFFHFFKENMLFLDAQPNRAHVALADLEKRGIVKAVITQNIDGLHQKAGSERVIELHGASGRYYCTGCGRVFGNEIMCTQETVPHCDACRAVVRPDVTLYGEALDGFTFADAKGEIAQADVLIVGGTSLVVNPAASLIDTYQGNHLIIVNRSPTPYDGVAEYVFRESLSQVLATLAEGL